MRSTRPLSAIRRKLGAALARGTYAEAIEVERIVSQARSGIARLIGAQSPRRIVFTNNCTSALNLAIHGLLRSGDHAVTTVVEHNSVLRPLRQLEDAGMIGVTRVGCDGEGVVAADDVRRALRPTTRLIAVSHASNVTGAIQPIAEIACHAREHGALLLIDAAQTAGHVPVDVEVLGAGLLAAAGHKGLLGPLGTGFLYIAAGIEERLASLVQGGTGTVSDLDRQPDTMPDKYEAGNLNAPGLVGLEAGLAYLDHRGTASLVEHARRLTDQLWQGLREVPGVRLYGPAHSSQRVGVISFTLDGYDPQELAATLEGAYRIQGRAGLHCAPLMHRALATSGAGGTLRLSVGPFNTESQITAVVDAISELAAARTL